MPQLDKYIFFNQIIYLTFFFFLIYVYIRGLVIPEISSILKYRKKKFDLFNSQINSYINNLLSTRNFLLSKTKIYISDIFELVNSINVFLTRQLIF